MWLAWLGHVTCISYLSFLGHVTCISYLSFLGHVVCMWYWSELGCTHNLIATGLPLSSSLTRGTFIPPSMMTTTSQLTLSHTCYCTHCHTLTLHTLHTSHTPHTSHFAWHLFLFHIITFITHNRNLFCVYNVIVVINCLKTLQTPAEEIKMDMLVVCYISGVGTSSGLGGPKCTGRAKVYWEGWTKMTLISNELNQKRQYTHTGYNGLIS